LYNILIEFRIPMKLVRLIKMCLNETYSKVRIGKHLSDNFPIQSGLKQGDALLPLLFNFALEYAMYGADKLLKFANLLTSWISLRQWISNCYQIKFLPFTEK
jgi:hypothetical protein